MKQIEEAQHQQAEQHQAQHRRQAPERQARREAELKQRPSPGNRWGSFTFWATIAGGRQPSPKRTPKEFIVFIRTDRTKIIQPETAAVKRQNASPGQKKKPLTVSRAWCKIESSQTIYKTRNGGKSQGPILFRVAGPRLYYTMEKKNLQVIDKRTFAEKITDAKEEKTLDESGQGDARKWGNRTRLQYYLTEVCDFVQAAHPEFKTHTHKGATVTAAKWNIIHKSRRMSCIKYGEMALNVQTGKHSFVDARLCGLKTCPVCAKIMANKNEQRINAAIETEQAKKESRDNARYKALGITLTVPNCTGPELRRELQNISKSVKTMLHMGSKIKDIWYFAVVGLEVTKNTETGLFHPHAHIVIFVAASYGKKGTYMSQKELVELWRKYSHRKVSGAAQYIKVVKNIHQSVKYATKLVKLPFEDDENEDEDAAAEAEKEESLVWTGKPEFDAETLYWIETACKGLHMTKTYKLDVKIVEDMREVTPEDVEALENEDEKQVYLLQEFARLKGQIMVRPKREELLTKKELLEHKRELTAQKSIQSREAWERRRIAEKGAKMIANQYNEAAAAAAAKRDSEILADVKELAKAGPKGRAIAMRRLKEIQDEKTYREAIKAISEGGVSTPETV